MSVDFNFIDILIKNYWIENSSFYIMSKGIIGKSQISDVPNTASETGVRGFGSFRPWVVSDMSRFGRGSFRLGRFGLGYFGLILGWVVSA